LFFWYLLTGRGQETLECTLLFQWVFFAALMVLLEESSPTTNQRCNECPIHLLVTPHHIVYDKEAITVEEKVRSHTHRLILPYHISHHSELSGFIR
jgi:hypothetical protein